MNGKVLQYVGSGFSRSVFVTGGLVLLLARPSAAQVDQARAQAYFAEANAICERDAGALWGVSLCGPMVVFDVRTQTIATSEPAPTAPRPPQLGLVNAPLNWGGRSWTAYAWAFFAIDDAVQRKQTLMHELFHHVQPQLGLFVGGASNDHVSTLDGRYWLQLEWRALSRALTASSDERTSALADALAFRRERHARFPGSADSERVDEIREGLASYTGNVLAAASPDDAVASVVKQLADIEQQASFVAVFGYPSGAAYGTLLDRLAPGWRREVRGTSDLAEMLAAATNVRPSESSSAALRYRGPELRAAEEARDAREQQRITAMRRRFVEGPVLVVPRGRGASFDTRGLTVIPGAGTVYVVYGVTAEWGRLDVTNGVLVSSDNMTLVLPAPPRTDAQPLTGDGWTMTLAPGWSVKPGPRAGDYRIER